jgi:hypothetical protein
MQKIRIIVFFFEYRPNWLLLFTIMYLRLNISTRTDLKLYTEFQDKLVLYNIQQIYPKDHADPDYWLSG